MSQVSRLPETFLIFDLASLEAEKSMCKDKPCQIRQFRLSRAAARVLLHTYCFLTGSAGSQQGFDKKICSWQLAATLCLDAWKSYRHVTVICTQMVIEKLFEIEYHSAEILK